MAVKIGNIDLTATLSVGDEEVEFIFREPSNEEQNKFIAKRYEVKRNKMKDNSLAARVEFFDLLLTGVNNLVDDKEKPITPARKELIPNRWKDKLVFRLFEDDEVEVKN